MVAKKKKKDKKKEKEKKERRKEFMTKHLYMHLKSNRKSEFRLSDCLFCELFTVLVLGLDSQQILVLTEVK